MSFFEKLFIEDKNSALKEIKKDYKNNHFLLVNYLYFASLVTTWLIGKNQKNIDYEKALSSWDYLLPDGIALRLLYKKFYKKNISNLNWTDFIKFFLENFWENYELILFWAKDNTVRKATEYIENYLWIKVFYAQDGYKEFDFSKLDKIKKSNKSKILLTGLWSPLQEIWAYKNLEKIKEYWLLVFSQWWTFEFWAWNEKRAPKIFQKLKIEWFWRLCQNPKKNYKKVLNSLLFFYYYIFWKKKNIIK